MQPLEVAAVQTHDEHTPILNYNLRITNRIVSPGRKRFNIREYCRRVTTVANTVTLLQTRNYNTFNSQKKKKKMFREVFPVCFAYALGCFFFWKKKKLSFARYPSNRRRQLFPRRAYSVGFCKCTAADDDDETFERTIISSPTVPQHSSRKFSFLNYPHEHHK